MSVISLTTGVCLNDVDIGDFFQQSLKIEHTAEAHFYMKSSSGLKLATMAYKCHIRYYYHMSSYCHD